jgi:hypothetical protein
MIMVRFLPSGKIRTLQHLTMASSNHKAIRKDFDNRSLVEKFDRQIFVKGIIAMRLHLHHRFLSTKAGMDFLAAERR